MAKAKTISNKLPLALWRGGKGVRLFLFLGVLLLTACSRLEKTISEHKYRVLVVHSYENISRRYANRAEPAYEQAFKGRNVDLRHVYCNIPHVVDEACVDWYILPQLKKLEEEGWRPQVVITQQDDALAQWYSMLQKYGREHNHYARVPIVYTGVICADSVLRNDPRLTRHLHVTGWKDSVDWKANLLFFEQIWPQAKALVVYGHTVSDSLGILPLIAAKHELDSLGIPCPELEIHTNRRILGNYKTHDIVMAARSRPHLQVKRFVRSNTLIDLSRRPQLSVCNTQFQEKNPIRILGGHFSLLQTQADDAARYAMLILRGKQAEDLPVGIHNTQNYLDWEAMEQYGMSYRTYASKATILNAPTRVRTPGVYMMLMFLAGLGVMGLIGLLAWGALRWIYNTREARLMRTQQQRLSWILHSNKAVLFNLHGEELHLSNSTEETQKVATLRMADPLRITHPDHRDEMTQIITFQEKPGPHRHRMLLSLTENPPYKWNEIVYYLTPEDIERRQIRGISINVDREKQDEEELMQTVQAAEEAKLKEAFLANISHDIRTPLSSIVGYAYLLADEETEVSDDDRHLYAKQIEDNTAMLLKLLGDVIDTSKLQMGEYRFQIATHLVGNIVEQVYQTGLILVPHHLTLQLKSAGEVAINVDRERIIQVLNNFLSNAIKATRQGSITLGWEIQRPGMESYPQEGKGEQWVSLYVEDTGVGIPKHEIKNIFNSFTKRDGDTQGAGLGLSICRTIVEKQRGAISVRSRVGRGSRFMALFRVAQMLVMACMLFSCQQRGAKLSRPDGLPFQVAVVHGYDEDCYTYQEYNQALEKQFLHQGINAQLNHVYLDIYDYRYRHEKYDCVDSLLHSPGTDLVITEGNFACNALMEGMLMHDSTATAFPMPVVAGGMTTPDWDMIQRISNMYVWTDELDFARMIDFAIHITGTTLANTELDYTKPDSIIRTNLKEALVENMIDPDLKLSDPKLLQIAYDHQVNHTTSMRVCAISLHEPDSNTIVLPDTVIPGEEVLRRGYLYSHLVPQIVLKKDMSSYQMAGYSQKPQFSVIPYDFGDPRTRFLAGYFPTMTEQAKDVVHTAAKILQDDMPYTRHCGRHIRTPHMDYNAMKIYGLEFADYASDWKIENTPLHLSNPWLYWGRPVAVLIVLMIVIFTVLRQLYLKNLVRLKKMQEQLFHSNMSLLGGEGYAFQYTLSGMMIVTKENLMSMEMSKTPEVEQNKLINMLHPDYVDIQLEMEAITKSAGKHDLEMPLSLDGGQTFHWWSMRLTVLPNARKDTNVIAEGIMMNKDTEKERDKELQQMKQRAQETKAREEFLNSMNHEIRTPLNSVLGFSDILATPGLITDPAERHDLCRNIRHHSDLLLSLVQDILDFSRIESGRMKYDIKSIPVDDFMQEFIQEYHGLLEGQVLFDENGAEKPGPIRLIYTPGRPGTTVLADKSCLKKVLHHMMKNAIKFTPQGNIYVSWTYHMSNGMVDFYVEDTGEGMQRELLRDIFQQFYKFRQISRGIGLGLSICQSLVQGMEGQISVDSQVGYGSRFCVSLPASAALNGGGGGKKASQLL